MRRLCFDQYELPPADSEQSLELAVSTTSQHSDLGAPLADVGASAVEGPVPPSDWPRWPDVARHLRLAGIDLPDRSEWRGAALISDDWDDVELGIAFGSILVWYHWWTTA